MLYPLVFPLGWTLSSSPLFIFCAIVLIVSLSTPCLSLALAILAIPFFLPSPSAFLGILCLFRPPSWASFALCVRLPGFPLCRRTLRSLPLLWVPLFASLDTAFCSPLAPFCWLRLFPCLLASFLVAYFWLLGWFFLLVGLVCGKFYWLV